MYADLQIGDAIPDFTVQMNDGSHVTGSQLRKGISVIMFFHTGCPDCQKTLPSVLQIYDEYVGDVNFALISREQGDGEIAPYWADSGYTMPYSAQTAAIQCLILRRQTGISIIFLQVPVCRESMYAKKASSDICMMMILFLHILIWSEI